MMFPVVQAALSRWTSRNSRQGKTDRSLTSGCPIIETASVRRCWTLEAEALKRMEAGQTCE